MPSFLASILLTLVDSIIASKRFSIRFCNGRTKSRSQPVIKSSINSTTLTFVPSASYTVPISSPIIPPPITNIRFGISSNLSAPVESMILSSSGALGNLVACEPAAIMALSKPMVVILPSAAVTAIWFGAVNAPKPCTTVTSRCLAMALKPPVSLATTSLFFQSFKAAKSIFGLPKLTPCAAVSSASVMTFAVCNKAFDGMQPTFKHTPPSVA